GPGQSQAIQQMAVLLSGWVVERTECDEPGCVGRALRLGRIGLCLHADAVAEDSGRILDGAARAFLQRRRGCEDAGRGIHGLARPHFDERDFFVSFLGSGRRSRAVLDVPWSWRLGLADAGTSIQSLEYLPHRSDLPVCVLESAALMARRTAGRKRRPALP